MIPFTTNTVRVERLANPLQDSLVEPTWIVVATGVPCVLGSLSGFESPSSGAQIVRTGAGRFDPGVDIRSYDRLVDEVSNDMFECGNVQPRVGFGLDHVQVQLRRVVGANA